MSFDAVARGAGADGVTIDLPLSDDRPARQDTDTDGEGSGPGTLSGSSRLDSIDNTSVTDVHEAQDDWNAFIMQTTVGSAFAHIDAPHVVSPDIWRHSRWQRMYACAMRSPCRAAVWLLPWLMRECDVAGAAPC